MSFSKRPRTRQLNSLDTDKKYKRNNFKNHFAILMSSRLVFLFHTYTRETLITLFIKSVIVK